MNYYKYFVTKKAKKYLSNISYRKLTLNCKQNSKIRKKHFFIFYTANYIKAVQKQPLADVLQNTCS